jgi:hypothetical protein
VHPLAFTIPDHAAHVGPNRRRISGFGGNAREKGGTVT